MRRVQGRAVCDSVLLPAGNVRATDGGRFGLSDFCVLPMAPCMSWCPGLQDERAGSGYRPLPHHSRSSTGARNGKLAERSGATRQQPVQRDHLDPVASGYRAAVFGQYGNAVGVCHRAEHG